MTHRPIWMTCLALAAAALAAGAGGCRTDEWRGTETPMVVKEAEIRPTPGCWVEVFEEDAFGGRFLRLAGPARYPALEIGGESWAKRVQSVVVGPNAWVKLQDEPRFRGRVLWLVPNQKIRDLDELKYGGVIESIEIFDHPVGEPPRAD